MGTGETKIEMFLDTAVNTRYTIRFYSNLRDTGEGKTFIGQVENVTTSTNGTSSLNDFIAAKTVPVGQSITATDPADNTSEFTGKPRSVRLAPSIVRARGDISAQPLIGTASNPFSVLLTLTRKSPGSW